jgi:hypothetical protein
VIGLHHRQGNGEIDDFNDGTGDNRGNANDTAVAMWLYRSVHALAQYHNLTGDTTEDGEEGEGGVMETAGVTVPEGGTEGGTEGAMKEGLRGMIRRRPAYRVFFASDSPAMVAQYKALDPTCITRESELPKQGSGWLQMTG